MKRQIRSARAVARSVALAAYQPVKSAGGSVIQEFARQLVLVVLCGQPLLPALFDAALGSPSAFVTTFLFCVAAVGFSLAVKICSRTIINIRAHAPCRRRAAVAYAVGSVLVAPWLETQKSRVSFAFLIDRSGVVQIPF